MQSLFNSDLKKSAPSKHCVQSLASVAALTSAFRKKCGPIETLVFLENTMARKTLFQSTLEVIADWKKCRKKPACMVKSMEELIRSAEETSQQQAKSSASRNPENVGRPRDTRREAIAEMLLIGKTTPEIQEATKASVGLISKIRKELSQRIN